MATEFNDLGYAANLVGKFLHATTIIKDVGKVTALVAQTTSSGGQYYATPQNFGALASGVGYQVPSGKKFIIFGIRAIINANAAFDLQIGTGESDVGFNTTSIATNAQYGFVYTTAATIGTYDISIFSEIPENKYAFFAGVGSAGSCYATIYGFEIDADATSI